jgi:hypothetical protein
VLKQKWLPFQTAITIINLIYCFFEQHDFVSVEAPSAHPAALVSAEQHPFFFFFFFLLMSLLISVVVPFDAAYVVAAIEPTNVNNAIAKNIFFIITSFFVKIQILI